MKLSKSDGDKYLQAQSFLNSKSKVENEKGIHVIAELVKDYPCLGKLRAVYANALWDRGDIEIATKEFQQAILFSPKSKMGYRCQKGYRCQSINVQFSGRVQQKGKVRLITEIYGRLFLVYRHRQLLV